MADIADIADMQRRQQAEIKQRAWKMEGTTCGKMSTGVRGDESIGVGGEVSVGTAHNAHGVTQHTHGASGLHPTAWIVVQLVGEKKRAQINFLLTSSSTLFYHSGMVTTIFPPFGDNLSKSWSGGGGICVHSKCSERKKEFKNCPKNPTKFFDPRTSGPLAHATGLRSGIETNNPALAKPRGVSWQQACNFLHCPI